VTRIHDPAPDSVRPARSLRDYRLLFGAFVVSTAGDWLYKLALPLLVLQLTGSAVQTAVVYSLEYLPYLMFAPIGGVLSDRYDRRLLLIRADVAAAAVIGLLAAFAWFDRYHLWMIYLAAFVLSSITPLYQATFQGMVPGTVPPERLSWANSRMQAGQSTVDLAGPLLGAGAVAALGAPWALTLDSASFALSALTVALIAQARMRRPHAERVTVVGDLAAAVRFVRAHPPLLWGAVVAAGSSFGLFMVEANMITYLVRFRGLPVASVGLVGASTTIFIVTFFTLRHQLVPEHLLGRVVVITRLIAFSTVPVAPIVGGALLSATGTFWPVIVVSAAAQIGVGVAALFTPLGRAPA
jgi:MFS family permease